MDVLTFLYRFKSEISLLLINSYAICSANIPLLVLFDDFKGLSDRIDVIFDKKLAKIDHFLSVTSINIRAKAS